MTKVEREKETLRLYLDESLSISDIADSLSVSTITINRCLNKHSVLKNPKPKLNLSKEDVDNIISLYKEGKTLKYIGDTYGVVGLTIKQIILKNNIEIRYSNSAHKKNFTDAEKCSIIHEYNKGCWVIDICEKYDRSATVIKYWLRKWGIELRTQSDISTQIRKEHGATKGFTGKRHNSDSKKSASDKLKTAYKTGSKLPKTSKQIRYKTVLGDVDSSYELAYIQKAFEEHNTLPTIPNPVETPLGMYYPDFELYGNYIEIKSSYIWKACKGEITGKDGIKTDTQYQKILWVSKNIKNVNVLVLEQKEVTQLIKNMIFMNHIVLEKIELKGNKIIKKKV